jgi:glycine cleavage system H protein
LVLAYGLLLLAVFGLWLAGRHIHRAVRDWRDGLQIVQGFRLHPRLHYHAGHTWVMPLSNGLVRVGIDDFGRKIVDGVRGMKLPSKGSKLVEGEVAIHLQCGKRQAKLLSPVDGVVVEVNEALVRGGALPDEVERDPYGEGWLLTVKVPDRRFMRLPTRATAKEWLGWEADRLSLLMHRELGVLAADGGDLISKPSVMLNEEQWQALTQTFFKTA